MFWDIRKIGNENASRYQSKSEQNKGNIACPSLNLNTSFGHTRSLLFKKNVWFKIAAVILPQKLNHKHMIHCNDSGSSASQPFYSTLLFYLSKYQSLLPNSPPSALICSYPPMQWRVSIHIGLTEQNNEHEIAQADTLNMDSEQHILIVLKACHFCLQPPTTSLKYALFVCFVRLAYIFCFDLNPTCMKYKIKSNFGSIRL